MQGNNEFAVDQACAGLNMLATSLIICLFILAWYQKRMCCQFSIYQVICLLILTIILNILCNLIRIILLVQFKIAPELIYHDLIGIICLLVYVIIPLVLVVKWLGSNYALKSPAQTKDLHPFPKLRFPILHISLVITLVLISVNLKNMNQIVPHINSINLQGYQKKTLNNGILKFENSESLVYLKSGTFYAPEHDPMVCWKGSGYTFKSIKKEKYASTEVYTGVLEKGNDTIYSAWWFTNGKLNTVNQFKWRWKAAKGEGDFYLVNINVQNASDLKRLTTALLSKNLGL
jgi:exosortase N